MRKSVFKAFGVATATLSLLAMFAATPRADASNFLVLGLKSLVKGTEIAGQQIGSGQILIPSKNAYLDCSGGIVTKSVGLSESEGEGTVRFQKCATFNLKTKALLAACPVEGEPSKETIDAAGTVLPILHEGELFVIFHVVKTIKFGPECAIGLKVVTKGPIAALVTEGSVSQVAHRLVISEAIQKLLGLKLLYGTAEAFIDGEAEAELAGVHKGCTWAVQ